MIRECAFILPSGRKCRCAATRNQAVCRHHAPRPAIPGPPPTLRRELYSRHIRWTQLGRLTPWLDPAEIPNEVHSILRSLLEDGPLGISDREAGRLLRGLLRRLGQVPFPLPDPEDFQPPSPAPARSQDARSMRGPVSDPTLDPEDSVNDPAFAALLESLASKLPRPSSAPPTVTPIEPGLTQFRPDPRHMQPNVTHMRPSSK